ncbi:hypothetical protein OAU50_08685 [Planctomycetota bacterium]|nr:hypothetical protein [Planctomycetota bacterium]
MATVRDLRSKANKAMAKWKKEFATLSEKDNSSPVTHLCRTILLRQNTTDNAKKAEQVLRDRFIDWNEIRVSPIAEVQTVLDSVKTPGAKNKAFALRRFLRDIFDKYNKTSFNFDLMPIPEVVLPKGEGEEPDEEDDNLVTRESGLPDHPEIPGFIDMQLVLDQPVPLEPKLVMEKNSPNVAMVAWDQIDRGPWAALWRVSLAEGFIEADLEGFPAVQRLRQIAPEKDRDLFTFYALVHAAKDWSKLVKASDKQIKKIRKAAKA